MASNRGSKPRINREVVVSEKAHAFLSSLVAADELDVGELLYLLQKPWKWEDEYLTWLRRGENQ